MPKNMKYDAVATKAAGPKKKMKSNQDGGSVTAKDPAAAGKQLAANQKGAAQHKKGPAKYDRVVLGGNKGDVSKTKPGKKDYDGGAKMGYSQKFGPGRMNGYDAGAEKVMDVMTLGASKYMAEGPGQTQPDHHTREFRAKRKRKFDAMNARLRNAKDEARTWEAIDNQRNIRKMQADVKDGTRPAFSNPSINPIDGMTYSYGARLMKGGDKMIDPAGDDMKQITRGADGYYTANAFPRNRRSPRSREEFTGTYRRDRGDRPTPYVQGSFDFAKRRYEQQAQGKADSRNRMINEFKTKVGIDVNREAAAAAQNRVASVFNRGIGSVKNSTAKNPTGLKSYEIEEIN